MQFLDPLINTLTTISQAVPLPVFVILGSFIEEAIPPLPASVVLTVTGNMAFSQTQPLLFLFALAAISSFIKTLAAWVFYIFADKIEDVLIGRFGKRFGITHKEVENVSKHFKGNNKDEIIMFLARAIPVLPTLPFSVVAGIIKMPVMPFLITTFLGLTFRSVLYLYVGYFGIAGLQEFLERVNNPITLILSSLISLLLLVGIVVWYVRNKETIQKAVENILSPKKK
jgi:membrane protein DedA with SNARE-associated domain